MRTFVAIALLGLAIAQVALASEKYSYSDPPKYADPPKYGYVKDPYGGSKKKFDPFGKVKSALEAVSDKVHDTLSEIKDKVEDTVESAVCKVLEKKVEAAHKDLVLAKSLLAKAKGKAAAKAAEQAKYADVYGAASGSASGYGYSKPAPASSYADPPKYVAAPSKEDKWVSLAKKVVAKAQQKYAEALAKYVDKCDVQPLADPKYTKKADPAPTSYTAKKADPAPTSYTKKIDPSAYKKATAPVKGHGY